MDRRSSCRLPHSRLVRNGHHVADRGRLPRCTEPAIAGTRLLIALTAAKWLLIISTVVVALLGALVRESPFSGVRHVARLLWALRVRSLQCSSSPL